MTDFHEGDRVRVVSTVTGFSDHIGREGVIRSTRSEPAMPNEVTLNGGFTTFFSDKELELVKEKKALKVGDRVRVVKYGSHTKPDPDGDGWVGKEGTLATGKAPFPWRANRDDGHWTYLYDSEVELIEPEPTLAERLEEAKTLVKVLEAQVESEGIAKYADADLGTIVTMDAYGTEERFVKIGPNSWVYINGAERGGTTRVYPDTYLAEYGQQEIPF